jgi:hypothetical protein
VGQEKGGVEGGQERGEEEACRSGEEEEVCGLQQEVCGSCRGRCACVALWRYCARLSTFTRLTPRAARYTACSSKARVKPE